MLPKEEKFHSNKLISRLYKQNKNLITGRNPNEKNDSLVNLRLSPEEKYLVPKIAKGKLKPIDNDDKKKKRIFSQHLRSEVSKLGRSEKSIMDSS